MNTEKVEPDTLLACVDEIAAQVHEGRFSEGQAQINYNTFADEYSDGQQYCRRIARKLLEKFQIRRRAALARCDAQSVAEQVAVAWLAPDSGACTSDIETSAYWIKYGVKVVPLYAAPAAAGNAALDTAARTAQ